MPRPDDSVFSFQSSAESLKMFTYCQFPVAVWTIFEGVVGGRNTIPASDFLRRRPRGQAAAQGCCSYLYQHWVVGRNTKKEKKTD